MCAVYTTASSVWTFGLSVTLYRDATKIGSEPSMGVHSQPGPKNLKDLSSACQYGSAQLGKINVTPVY